LRYEWYLLSHNKTVKEAKANVALMIVEMFNTQQPPITSGNGGREIGN
jgi:hypothetical protein